MSDSESPAPKPGAVDWNALLKAYRKPVAWRSFFQVANTSIPFVACWIAMLLSLAVSYWLTLLLAVPTALLMVRLFMIQHDCGHGSFFRSQWLNNVLGGAIGVVTLVPYEYWRKTHSVHHAGSGNLDSRSFGDIDTLTVREYLSRSRFKRFLYRLYRHPLVMLVIGPAYQFVLKHRLPIDTPRSWKRAWLSVLLTNIALAAVVTTLALTLSWQDFLMVQTPIVLIAGTVGVYLFYVQHQFEDTYWRYREHWNYYAAGLEGASHLVMPKILQWFTANIGLHHIHHVCSRIPNYHLQRCYDEVPALQKVTRLGLWRSFGTLRLTLWDEAGGRLIGFRELRALRPALLASSQGGTITPTKPTSVPRSWR